MHNIRKNKIKYEGLKNNDKFIVFISDSLSLPKLNILFINTLSPKYTTICTIVTESDKIIYLINFITFFSYRSNNGKKIITGKNLSDIAKDINITNLRISFLK